MAESIHTQARDLLLASFQDTTVAAAAGIAHPTWVNNVLTGDRDGYIGELHRGRLPAVEIFQTQDSWKQSALDLGSVTSDWTVRVHVGGFDMATAEARARQILYAGLIMVRAENYFKIGDEVVSKFDSGPLGHMLTASLTVVNAMSREDYETEPDSGSGIPAESEGDVGGISTTINYNDTSPIAILSLLAGQAIDTVSIQVITPFNGVSPTATIGIVGDQGRYLAANENDLTDSDSIWEKDANDAGPKTVKVWLSPGGSTAGQIKVQISVTNA